MNALYFYGMTEEFPYNYTVTVPQSYHVDTVNEKCNVFYVSDKDDGTTWISGTMHNIYSIGMALQQDGFKIINNITWKKLNPPPNISCRAFVHSTETILWAKKDSKKAKHKFNYSLMRELNGDKQMKDE